ncbi:LOW QUALITY PROTEIN: hypothetical protein Cgig2_012004 [Carnegiea gigantea]|uniref:Uncharacterized protein n=1 Tax=Carnegiea gigantea TaxID=171969 RepID=A0A9Q1QN31_9CARY|nr:LOW QUALITY PROTEIN: hypothetical protein Cgig2_012004 [Carnegiea gigantea]
MFRGLDELYHSRIEGAQLRQRTVAVEACGPSEGKEESSGSTTSRSSLAAKYVRYNFRCALMEPLTPGPRPLPPDYRGLCPCFDLGVAMRYAQDSNIPEMVQIIFYAMVVDDAAELGLAQRLTIDYVIAQASRLANPSASPVLAGGPSRGRTTSFPTFRDTTHVVEYIRDSLCWSVRESSSLRPNLLPLHFVALCPDFDHIVAMQFAHTAHIPEMAILFAIVINDATDLRLLSRETRRSLMLDLQELSRCLLRKGSKTPRFPALLRRYIILSRAQNGGAPEGLAGPQVEGCHPQFPSLPALIDGRVRQRQMAKTKSTPCVTTPNELLAEGMQGTSSSTSDGLSRRLSSEGASTSSSSHEGPPTAGKSILKRKGRSPSRPVPEIVAEEAEFPGAPARSDP